MKLKKYSETVVVGSRHRRWSVVASFGNGDRSGEQRRESPSMDPRPPSKQYIIASCQLALFFGLFHARISVEKIICLASDRLASH